MSSQIQNQSETHPRPKVRVAIAGIGNCASSLVQGVTHYFDATDEVPGLMHHTVAGYHVSDIEFVAAFDVAAAKVGLDLADAIFAGENNTVKFTDVAPTGVTVQRGPTLDGIGKYLGEVVELSDAEPVDVAAALRDARADVLINLLPVGSEEAVKFYAEQALAAGTGFVNCIPVFIAGKPEWRARFEEANLPIIGDDIKSQVGATILHRRVAQLFRDRGVKVLRTSQLNVGGNSDFRNMLERSRLDSKKVSKTNAVTSVLPYELDPKDIHVGPSDYVPWLEDRKWAHIRVEGEAFGGVPLNMEIKLEVVDSPNGHHHRRGAHGQVRHGPRHRRRPRVVERLPHEVAAVAARRRRRQGTARGVHGRWRPGTNRRGANGRGATRRWRRRLPPRLRPRRGHRVRDQGRGSRQRRRQRHARRITRARPGLTELLDGRPMTATRPTRGGRGHVGRDPLAVSSARPAPAAHDPVPIDVGPGKPTLPIGSARWHPLVASCSPRRIRGRRRIRSTT